MNYHINKIISFEDVLKKYVLGIKKRLFLIFSLTFLNVFLLSATSHHFTVVIDAGHGGHDPGALGKITQEKHINLAVALALGEKIEKNHKDVKVIYTRKKDFFVPLDKRADIANKNHADLFISIHTNAAKSKRARGAETYVLGQHRTKKNLEVAMRENAVITLEDDYKKRYHNFDPHSVDSYIMFNLMQDRYIANSIYLATQIQKEFKKTKRRNLGVRQAGFVVLYRSVCPSVLVELGFITNRGEERFLKSKAGRKKLASAIYKAFVKYKCRYDRKIKKTKDTIAGRKEKVEDKTLKIDKIYKIQLFAVKRKLPSDSKHFKGLENVDYYKEGSYYKYTYGNTTDYDEIKKLKKDINRKFPKSIIIIIKDNKRIK